MPELTIVDYDANNKSEKALTTILKRHGATVEDWMEKDYGLKVFVSVPAGNISDLKNDINNNKNFSYDL